MTVLCYRNPGRRIVGAVRGLVRRPRGSAKPLLTESRRETLGRATSIFADFELPGALEFAKRFGADCVSFGVSRRPWSDFRDELGRVLAARDTGRIDSVIVWTINDEKRMRELVRLNVDGILTDDARLLRRIVSERSPAQ